MRDELDKAKILFYKAFEKPSKIEKLNLIKRAERLNLINVK